MKNKAKPLRRFRSVREEKPNPVREVLRLVDRQISTASYRATSLTDFRKSLKAIASDDAMWEKMGNLLKAVKALKTSIEELL